MGAERTREGGGAGVGEDLLLASREESEGCLDAARAKPDLKLMYNFT